MESYNENENWNIKIEKNKMINKLVIDEFMSLNLKYFNKVQNFPYFKDGGMVEKNGKNRGKRYCSVSYEIDKNENKNDFYVSIGGSIQIQVENQRNSPFDYPDGMKQRTKTDGRISIEFCRKYELKNFFFEKKKFLKQFVCYEFFGNGDDKYLEMNSFFNGNKYITDMNLLNPIIDPVDKNLFEEVKKLGLIQRRVHKNLDNILKEKKEKKLKEFKKSQTNVLTEFDKDGNGIIDIIEVNDDFMKLFRKHQIIIKSFDQNYINNLVKVSNYLKTKRKNIQEIFTEITNTKNEKQLETQVGLLKNQIHTYEQIFYHSLQLINSIVQDDFITVNEIYEEFDKLKIFKSDHEREVSEKLSDIKFGLTDLMYSINKMEMNIVSGLNELTYITSDGFSNLNNSLSNELKSIQSTIGFNNLLTGIQTYQMYKINKNTKSLRS